jgi:hypothetical protein
MDGTRDHQIKENKLDSERQISHIFSHMWKLEKDWKQKGGCLEKEPVGDRRGK